MADEFREPVFPVEKDFTRPTFDRKPGELGIFIDLYDAEPVDKNAFGSRQYLLMTLVDRFFQEVSQAELFKIKGFFYKRNLMNGITMENFLPGILLIVNTNTKDSLDKLVMDYESGKLNEAFIECFVTEKIEKKLEFRKIKLKIKIFPDEISAVSSEWQSKHLPRPYLISQSEKDFRMIYTIKKFQQNILSNKLYKLKDDGSQFESSSTEFLQYLKQHSHEHQEEIKNIADAQKLCKYFTNLPEAQKHLSLFQKYLSVIGELQQTARDIEIHVLFPLNQIRIGSESAGQRDVHIQIQNQINNLKTALKEKSPFTLFSSRIEFTIPKHDRKVWAGMIYLIPGSVEIIFNVDQLIDHYFQLNNFNQIVKEFEHKPKTT